MKAFFESLLSRKLILAVVSVVYFLLNGMTNEAVVVIMTYFGVNGYEKSIK
jgi:hypothetical protein